MAFVVEWVETVAISSLRRSSNRLIQTAGKVHEEMTLSIPHAGNGSSTTGYVIHCKKYYDQHRSPELILKKLHVIQKNLEVAGPN
jgi:hypothetical protein